MAKDFVFSADGHILEPTDLFRTRLPKHLRDRAVWEEDFEIEPLVEGGARVFRKLHTVGFEGWTVSRYRQTGGRTPEGDPEQALHVEPPPCFRAEPRYESHVHGKRPNRTRPRQYPIGPRPVTVPRVMPT